MGQNGGSLLAYNNAGEPVGFMSATSSGGLLATYDAAGTLGTLVSSDSNGGEVQRRLRTLSPVTGFGRIED